MGETQIISSLIKYFQLADLDISDNGIEKMAQFYDFLEDENKHYNLTAIKTPEEAAVRHFVDSLMLARIKEFINSTTVLDVGSGAGFPGIPLAIVCEKKQFTLLDSLKKRVVFLHKATARLGLNNVNILHHRAELFAQKPQYRGQFEIVTARAVADLAVLSEYCLPAVKLKGHFIALKSLDIDSELTNAGRAINLLGGGGLRQVKYKLPDGRGRQLIIIEKVKNTPQRYPRRPGAPKKSPL